VNVATTVEPETVLSWWEIRVVGDDDRVVLLADVGALTRGGPDACGSQSRLPV
jgi:hypothetical protein